MDLQPHFIFNFDENIRVNWEKNKDQDQSASLFTTGLNIPYRCVQRFDKAATTGNSLCDSGDSANLKTFSAMEFGHLQRHVNVLGCGSSKQEKECYERDTSHNWEVEDKFDEKNPVVFGDQFSNPLHTLSSN